jgi:hypothetical protein
MVHSNQERMVASHGKPTVRTVFGPDLVKLESRQLRDE